MTETEWAAKMRDERLVKDKTYQLYPLGMEVARFLRAKRVEGASVNTRDSYETTLRLFTLDHRDLETLERFCEPDGKDLVVAFLDERWGDSQPATLDQRTKAVNSFFAWAEDTGRTSKLIRIKRKWVGERRQIRAAHAMETIRAIAAAQPTLRDQIFVLLMGRLGLRKMEAGNLRVGDVDLAADVIRLRVTKGGMPAVIPIADRELRDLLYLWMQEKPRNPNVYIFHPAGHPERRPNQSTVHRRFAKCLERAGVAHFPMHEMRHSAADHIARKTRSDLAASELLRHSDPSVTRRYLHPTGDDLRAWILESE